jgi:hypothetical protein
MRNRQRLPRKLRKARANNYRAPAANGFICEANESAIELLLTGADLRFGGAHCGAAGGVAGK